ncbi:MAG: hypothetical protein IKG56_03140 [Clostridia bacterium]|nr:hypothetical protein [Clostridia bacterium]
MSKNSIIKLINSYIRCKNDLNSVFSNIPNLNDENEIIVINQVSYRIKDLVDGSIRRCEGILENGIKQVLGENYSKFERILELQEEIEDIEEMERSENLKQRWIERKRNEIERLENELDNSLSPEKKMQLERFINKVPAVFYTEIGWVVNQAAHQHREKEKQSRRGSIGRERERRKADDFFAFKDTKMVEIIANYLLNAEGDVTIRLDESGNKCLYIFNNNLPRLFGRSPIGLHFGSEDKFIRIINNADGILNSYVLERGKDAFRAKLRLRYLKKESSKNKSDNNSTMPSEGSIKEQIEILTVKYLFYKKRIDSIKNKLRKKGNDQERLNLEKNIKKMNECKFILLRACIQYPDLEEKIMKYIKETPTIDKNEQKELEELNMDLKLSLYIKKSLLKIKSNKELVDFLKKNIDYIDSIKQVNYIVNGENDFTSLLQTIQEIQNEKDANKKNEMIRILVYRCVGKGTEGEDAFFPSTDDDIDSKKQIIDFIKSIDLGVADDSIEYLVDEAIKDKTSIKEDQNGDWTEEYKDIEDSNKSNIISFFKNGMIKHKMDLTEVEDAVEILKKLELLYGKDKDGVIDDISRTIDVAFNGDRANSTEEKQFLMDQFEDITLENDYTAFFDLLEKIIE